MASFAAILNPPVRIARMIMVVAGMLGFVLPGISQRKYYEYNNPQALRLTKKRIELLTSTGWECKQVDVYIRGDKTTYSSWEELLYSPDGTYSSRRLTGTWKVQYNRYLVHTAVDNKNRSNPIMGIYSVTHLNDTSMTLMKIQSSSGDMARKLTFQKSIVRVGKAYPTDQSRLSSRVNRNLPVRESDPAALDTFRKIFDEDEPVNFYVVPQRDYVSVDELTTVDSLALAFIKNFSGDHSGRSTITSLKPYFRQYVGYLDKAGHHIVCLNALLTYHKNWEKELIMPAPGTKVEGFRIFVDLTRGECFGLNLYGD